jgi:hypothetical protein
MYPCFTFSSRRIASVFLRTAVRPAERTSASATNEHQTEQGMKNSKEEIWKIHLSTPVA